MSKRLLARHLAREMARDEIENVGGAKMTTYETAVTHTWATLTPTNGGKDTQGEYSPDDYKVEDGY